MEKQLLIKEVKKLTGRADLEQALQLLDDFTTADPKYDELHDQVVQTNSQLAQLQKDQNAGVISFENAKLSLNQITRQILAILDELEVKDGSAQIKSTRQKLIPWLLAAVLMFVFGALGAYFWFFQPAPPIPPVEPPVTEASFCNGFNEEDAEFRALILPYYYISVPLGTHKLIRLRLGDLRDKYLIKLESEIYNDSTLAHSDKYPANSDEAGAYGENCKAQLVIWGTEDKIDNQNKYITTKYKFLLGKDHFDLTKLKISDTGVDTIQSLSSILTQGEVTGEIEQIIKYIFGLIKFETGDYDDAIAALEDAQLPKEDSTAQLTKNMLLFDSYLKQGEETKAIKALDAALTTHPNYAWALNNRAALNYKEKRYEEASVDLEAAHEQLPNDATVVANRLQTSLAVEKIYVAKEALNKLQQMDAENRDLVARTPEAINVIKKRQEKVITSTKAILEKDPNNIKALQMQAITHLKQGNFVDAIKLAKQILEENPKQKAAYIILLEAYTKLEWEKEVVETMRKANENGLTKTILLEERNDLRMLIDKFTLKKK